MSILNRYHVEWYRRGVGDGDADIACFWRGSVSLMDRIGTRWFAVEFAFRRRSDAGLLRRSPPRCLQSCVTFTRRANQQGGLQKQ